MSNEPLPLPEPDPSDGDFGHTRSDLERWARGDEEAFARLWRRYEPALALMVARGVAAVKNEAVRRKLSAEDILQDAVKTVLEKLPDFEYRGPGSLFGWMEQIAARKVMDHVDYWEAGKRTPQREQRPADDGTAAISRTAPPDGRPGPRTEAEKREDFDRLRGTIADLSARHYRMIVLRYYLGASWEDIAREVGARSTEAVRKELSRLLPRLGARLGTP